MEGHTMQTRNIKMHWKILFLSLGIVLFSFLIGGIILLGSTYRLTQKELGQRLLITARTVAEVPEIRKNVTDPDEWQKISTVAEKIRVINGVSYIVVMNMERIRLSHPIRERIGETFHGEDAEPAFAEHSYISRVYGEIGPAVRVFVPVMNERNQQIGVVMVGHVLPTIQEMLANQRAYIITAIIFLFLFGIWGSWLLAKHIKRQMFELEPHEIARILLERTAAFHAIHEGVIAIDKDEKITIFNERAKEIFSIAGPLTGKLIRDIIPDTRLPEILELEKPVYNQELRVGNALIWSNRIPIKVNEETVGALAIFQDRTEVTRIAEELTGVRAFVDALRVQNHEHMNKLHTIAGLLQLDQKEKALDYLFEISEQQDELTHFLTKNIRDDNVAGLLLGKVSRGKELGIRVAIDKRSRLERFPEMMDHHDFVLLLGNIIENAFDSLQTVQRESKEVYISVEQNEDIASILVEDNGTGMDAETQHRIFDKGFSTKPDRNRGIGLYLVKQIVDKGGGELKLDSAAGSGTSFLITFPMKRGAEDGSTY
jgi:two-component system sensor histidine kinase DctS